MPMIWNAEAEARMFAAVIKTSEAIKFDYAKIAEYMGPECTAKAVNHRISNIKAVAKDLDKAWAPTAGTTAARIPKTPKTPKTPLKRTAKEANGDGEDGTETPTPKKIKTPGRASARGKGKKTLEEEEVKKEADVKEENDIEEGGEEAETNGHAAEEEETES